MREGKGFKACEGVWNFIYDGSGKHHLQGNLGKKPVRSEGISYTAEIISKIEQPILFNTGAKVHTNFPRQSEKQKVLNQKRGC